MMQRLNLYFFLSQLLTIGTHLSSVSIIVGDSQILSSSKVCDLGVVIDECLSLDDQISATRICRSINFHLQNIGRVRNLITTDSAAQLIHALISSRLDFCNSILYNLSNNKIERLQRIQSQAARILTRSSRRNYITPVVRDLHWLRFNNKIMFWQKSQRTIMYLQN